MEKTVVIVAGGKGLRMGSNIPKQFISIAGKPIIFHTINCFIKAVPTAEIILVLAATEIEEWKRISRNTPYQDIAVVAGGTNRFESVRKGLSKVNKGIVAIHDAVRPLVSQKTIQTVFLVAEDKGSAVPVVHLKDSIRKLDGKSSFSLQRNDFRLVQTPQCFEIIKLKAAYQQEYSEDFTDDASVFEAAGNKVFLVDGNEENIKITNPIDLKMAESLIPDSLD